GIELLKSLFAPKEELQTTQGLSEKNLRAFLEQKGIGEFLMYRYYTEDDKGLGIYHMAGDRKGIVLRVFPTAMSSRNIEDSVFSLVDNLKKEGTVIQFSTFGSRNIDHLLKNYKDLHHCNVNVDNANVLRELVDDTYDFFEKGVRETMVNGVDFRIKDFVSTISILFPENATDKYIRQVYNQLLGNLRKLNPIKFDGNSMVRMIKEMLNPDGTMESWDNYYDRHKDMNTQMANLGTTVKTAPGDHFEVGEKWKYRSLTTKQFPNTKSVLTGYDLYNLFFDRFGDNIQIPLPCPFFASLTVVVGNVEEEKESALKKARHDLKSVSKLNRETKLQHSELEPRGKEGKHTIELIEQHNQTPFKAMFSVTLMERNLDDLDRYTN
ncbi:MAG: TraC family protein, partial [Epsilonproteobacteria bacterium]|nr:TraC family protein [Campylobacterota bacterium]